MKRLESASGNSRSSASWTNEMASRRIKTHDFAVCIRNQGYAASLEVRKLYPVLQDSDAESNGLIRVIDESGDDYVYPAELFQRLALPNEIQRVLRLAS